MPTARVHNVLVFAESKVPEFKVKIYSYYAFKVFQARDKFHRDHPTRKVIKVLDLGVQEVEFARDKYDELYKNNTEL